MLRRRQQISLVHLLAVITGTTWTAGNGRPHTTNDLAQILSISITDWRGLLVESTAASCRTVNANHDVSTIICHEIGVTHSR